MPTTVIKKFTLVNRTYPQCEERSERPLCSRIAVKKLMTTLIPVAALNASSAHASRNGLM